MNEPATHAIAQAIESAAPATPSVSSNLVKYGPWPKKSPVEPLGVKDDTFFYLDSLRQLRVMKADKHSRNAVQSLFGEYIRFLWDTWPRESKKGACLGWDAAEATEALMAEASRRGVLDVVDRVRGPGGWVDENGDLVMHCGDAVYCGAATLSPGRIGRHIYPSAPEKPKPGKQADKRAAEELLEILKTWNWVRPDVDPYLLLGWIGAAMLGGALDWRPMIWITGDKATGKSHLHKLIARVIGPGGLISASDASAAGLWQYVGHASLPVALDELEAEEDNRKNANVIKLARHAASGGVTLRGGADHKGADFTVRSAFCFSSILIPPMLGQDVSRMAVLQLNPLAKGQAAPALDVAMLEKVGAVFRHRLLANWKRFGELLEIWRTTLGQHGHSGRSADQFGTLLACRDLLLHDTLPSSDELSEWAALLDRATLAEAEDDIPDHARCTQHLLTSMQDIFRSGERRMVGSWIRQAAYDADTEGAIKDAQRLLAAIGMKVEADKNGKKWLCVANNHQGLQGVFKETHWGARSGATGVWVQALRRVEGAQPGAMRRFDGVPARCTLLPLEPLLPKDFAEAE